MKQIGGLNNGNFLLEVSPRELTALQELRKVAAGHTLSPYTEQFPPREPLDEDMEKTLNAVWSWIELKDQANRLHHIASDLEVVLQVKSDEP